MGFSRYTWIMFFAEKITQIKPTDRVLEIGPGGLPHPRADILLERQYTNPDEAKAQRGHTPAPKKDSRIVYYDGRKFPFKDDEFDYVICSHVLEHIENVDDFLTELYRVAKRGYFEFPLAYYDYVYNFPEHLTFLFYDGKFINWMPKKDTPLQYFSSLQKLFYESMVQEHITFVDDLKHFFIQGFEWSSPVPSKKVFDIKNICFDIEKVKIPNLNTTNRLIEFRKLQRDAARWQNVRHFSFIKFFNYLKKQLP